MNFRRILILILILATLVIPFIQLLIGFYYVNSIELCPIQHDIMLLMAIGGVFSLISFASAFAFIFAITPPKFKNNKNLTAAQIAAKGSSRAMPMLIGCITLIFSICSIIYFILLHARIYRIRKIVQWTDPSETATYCLYTIYSSAFGMIIATYVAIVLFFSVSTIMLFGIGL